MALPGGLQAMLALAFSNTCDIRRNTGSAVSNDVQNYTFTDVATGLACKRTLIPRPVVPGKVETDKEPRYNIRLQFARSDVAVGMQVIYNGTDYYKITNVFQDCKGLSTIMECKPIEAK